MKNLFSITLLTLISSNVFARTEIPEPSSIALFSLGIIATILVARKSRK